jgi:putative DeoR family transcriptional regulator (stage III sporulation protein D)
MNTSDEIIEERVLQCAKLIILENSNVRMVARRIGCSKSTVHKDLSERLKNINYELYLEVQKIFEVNKQEKHIRGGNSTKNKYLNSQLLKNEV